MIHQNFEPESFVVNFLSADKSELINISKECEFSFSEDLLLYIQSHFRDKKKALPTYNQLDFFNKINEIVLYEKRNCAISSVTAKDAEASIILDTAKDLLAKRNLCQKKILGSAPLRHVASTASEYLKYIDCYERASYFHPCAQANTSNYYVHLNDKKPIFSLIDSSKIAKEGTDEKKTAIAILSPLDDVSDNEYAISANEFLSTPTAKSYISNYKTVSGCFGLLEILSAETNGIFVDLSKLSDVKKDENGKVTTLDPLLFSSRGRYVFDIAPNNLQALKSISEKFGLEVVIFAVRNDSELFITDKAKNPAFCFKFDFIQSLMSIQASKSYVFTKELGLGSRLPIFLTDKKDLTQKTYYANNFLSFTQIVASASARELDSAPYRTAAVTTLDAISSLITKGIPKSSIKLSINYTLLSHTDNEIELGKNFAAILGAYKTMIELCVSDSDPQISYDSEKRSIVVLASAKKQLRKTKSAFDAEESFIYFLPLFCADDGIPDYQKYRESVNLFYTLFEKDKINSSLYINENFSIAISNASAGRSIEYCDSFNADEISGYHGILFEAKKEISTENDMIFVGKSSAFQRSEQ